MDLLHILLKTGIMAFLTIASGYLMIAGIAMLFASTDDDFKIKRAVGSFILFVMSAFLFYLLAYVI